MRISHWAGRVSRHRRGIRSSRGMGRARDRRAASAADQDFAAAPPIQSPVAYPGENDEAAMRRLLSTSLVTVAVASLPWTSGLTVGRTTVRDRKSTRLNSSHSQISYAVFCLKKKKKQY